MTDFEWTDEQVEWISKMRSEAREDALKEVGERLDLWTFTNEEGWRIFPEATKFIEALCKGEMP